MSKQDILFVAVDGNGKKVYALEAYHYYNQTGYPLKGLICPRCGCPVYLTRRGATYYFAHQSTPEFRKSDCFNKRYSMCDINQTDSDVFFKNLFRKTRRSGPTTGGGGHERKNHRFFSRCFHLEHLHAYGFRYERNLTRLQEYRAEKFLMTTYLAPVYMPIGNESLRERAIYLKPEAVLSNRLALQFVFCWQVDSKHLKKKTFTLKFGEDHMEEFESWRNRLFDEEGNPLVKEVLVAADWIGVPKSECFQNCFWKSCVHKTAKWQCTGEQEGEFHTDKQILIVIDNDIEKRK